MAKNRMGKGLAQLKETQQRFDQNNQISIPKIQRVPKFLQENKRFYKYCRPKIISFGPIHHYSKSTKEGDHYKLLWASMFVSSYVKKFDQDNNQAYQRLLNRIEDNIQELKNMFNEDVVQGYNDNDLSWMLFVDECALLHFMENVNDQSPKEQNLKLDQLMYMWRDIQLLENQLPTKLLEILYWRTDLEDLFLNYHSLGACKRHSHVIQLELHKHCHILDYSRLFYLSKGNEHPTKNDTIPNPKIGDEQKVHWSTYKSLRDLKTVGIRVIANKTNEWMWSNISFKSNWFSGELSLPVFVFNDVTPYFFRNLIAFEMCPDVRYNYQFCSILTFIGSLVDNAEDVKELRKAGVFQNLLGSDEALAKFFHELGDYLPTKMYSNSLFPTALAYSKKYLIIKFQIEKHYTNKWKTWLAQAYNTYFNTPWTTIAFLAASLTLVLTFIQTWFAVKCN